MATIGKLEPNPDHTHVDVKGEVIRHEHGDSGQSTHWHHKNDSVLFMFGDETSLHYPDIDGKPDPRGQPHA